MHRTNLLTFYFIRLVILWLSEHAKGAPQYGQQINKSRKNANKIYITLFIMSSKMSKKYVIFVKILYYLHDLTKKDQSHS